MKRVELTLADLDWEPFSTNFAEQEDATTKFQGKVVEPEVVSRVPNMVIIEITCALPAADVTHDENFANILEFHVHVSRIQTEYLLTYGKVTSY